MKCRTSLSVWVSCPYFILCFSMSWSISKSSSKVTCFGQHHFLWEPHPDRLWDQVPFLCALVTLCTSCHRIYHNICRYSYLPWDYKLLKTVMVFLTQRWPRIQQSKPSNVCWMKKQTWEDNNLIHLSKKNGKSCLLSSQQTSIGITHQAYWNTGTFLWCSVSVSLRSFNFLP